MKIILIICLFIVFYISSNSQSIETKDSKIGVVLSGGGAKGIAEIGFLKVLEDNNIPIDYIGGTSIGAIVGGLYSMSYSPDEIYAFFQDPEFIKLLLGIIDTKDSYFYKRSENLGYSVHFELDFMAKNPNDFLKISPNMFPGDKMNFKFLEMTAAASAAAKYNFDSLMVPFFCVASDINNDEAMYMQKGDLGRAIRASMSLPFIFKPIRLDSIYLIDGGVYNNFPLDFMQERYKPDFIIGIQVSRGNYKIDGYDLVKQAYAMVMRKTNYEISKDKGIIAKIEFPDIGTLEFNEYKKAYLRGYYEGLNKIKEIKQLIKKRRSAEELSKIRTAFRKKIKPLVFKNFEIKAQDEFIKEYAKKVFYPKDSMTVKEAGAKFFMLTQDSYIDDVFPIAKFDSTTNKFTLVLETEVNNKTEGMVDANFSSDDIMQFYFGLQKKGFLKYHHTINLDASIGTFNNFFELRLKTFFNTIIPFYLKFKANYIYYDYYKNVGDKIIDLKNPVNLSTNTFDFKFEMGIPISKVSILKFVHIYSIHNNSFYQNANYNAFFEKDYNDISYNMTCASIEAYSLDDKDYPTEGMNHCISIRYKNMNETFFNGFTEQKVTNRYKPWLEFKAQINEFFPISNKYTFGFLYETYLSYKPEMYSYMTEILTSSEFCPTNFTNAMFNTSFRKNSYIAFGMQNIYNILKKVATFRMETYLYAPFRDFNYQKEETLKHTFIPKFNKPFNDVYLYQNIGLVYNSIIGPISLEYNGLFHKNTKPINHFTLNLGYRLFRKSDIRK